MIAIQKIGKSFLGALNYNLKKLYHPDPTKRAVMLDTNFDSLDAKIIRQELKFVRSLRPNLNRYVYHTSLNFSKDDNLDNEKLLAIAHDYLIESGYMNNQYLIFRHYDAEHPHIHLLVNRITFDGEVVSDSNNFKKSEAILRKLEQQYNLITVKQSNHRTTERQNRVTAEQGNDSSAEQFNHIPIPPNNNITIEPAIGVTMEPDIPAAVYPNSLITEDLYSQVPTTQANMLSQRAPTKDELEMVIRTGKPSEKMLLQELMNKLLKQRNISLQEFIKKGEQAGISFLFNQASTGRITGITYFHNGFKIKGQALGNRFKWAELIKKVDYEQGRDSKAISEANGRTRTKYGESTEADGSAQQHGRGIDMDAENTSANSVGFGRDENANERSGQTGESDGNKVGSIHDEQPRPGQDIDSVAAAMPGHRDDNHLSFQVEITDDEDDAKKRRKRRNGR